MTNIQLHSDVAAALHAQASAHGVTVDEYLKAVLFSSATRPMSRLTVHEFDRLLDEEAVAGPSPEGTFSRSEIYGDHD